VGKCNFCGKVVSMKKYLYTSGETETTICEDCLMAINLMAATRNQEREEKPAPAFSFSKKLASPRLIKEKLDETIVGQEEAKKAIAVAVYNHVQRIIHPEKQLQKSNILLIGPSGSGKTMLARALADFLEVPFTVADATTLTQAGYVGNDVESILSRLIQAANGDVSRAERGIVFIDEIDKIAKVDTGVSTSTTRDVSGEGVQQGLLKILEGTEADVPPTPGRLHPRGNNTKMNTENILFICGGAFPGMLEKEKNAKNTVIRPIGFCVDEKRASDEKDEKTMEEKLVEYGLLPEFLGRLPIHVVLDALGKDELLHVLKDVKGCLCEEYKNLFAFSDISLSFAEDALEEIADYVLEMRVGARGLRSVMERILADALFEMPGGSRKRFKVTKKLVAEKLNLKEVA